MTTPDWTSGSKYTWAGPASGGVWTDASNWQYDGEPATHAPNNQTSGTFTIPAGVTVTIPSTVSSLGYLTLDVQGTLVMPSSDSQLTFSKLVVENGGQATISRTLNINGGLQIDNGGTATFEGVTQNWTNPALNLSLQQGGTLNIDKSNIVLGNVNQSSGKGTLNITGGSVVSTASNSTDLSGPINVTGSSFTDSSSLASTTVLTLNDGATSTLSTSAYPADGSTVVFGTGNNTLVLPNLQYGANKVNIENLKNGDRLGVDGTKVTTATLSANNVALATASGTPIQVKSVTYDSSYTDAPTGDKTQTVTIDSGQGVICFLAGSMIATPNGVVAVENIRRGDEVLTFVNGVTHVRPVVWAGMAQATINPALPDDMAGYPVRILADAIAPGVPYQDLLVTAEHGIFANGMLVNGSSIFFDRSITDYTYYHVETAEHSIIMANGMLTESYLDTGNRRNFVSDGNVVTIGAKAKSWAEHAAVPLGTARHVVEPIWRVLAARAPDVAGHMAVCAKPEITHSHGLHLVTAAGTVIRPLRATGRNISFMLPAGVEEVRLVSRASRPCDVEGPFVDKRRMLGVLLGRVTVLSAGTATEITAHLAYADGAYGWQDMPQPTTRWTDGNALLPLSATTARGPALLTVEVLQAGPYLATPAAFTLPVAANG
ncbi:hypothetical protein FKW50_11855 [Acetobacter pomorum]|uniref:Hint domain-containing protein n=1 Tax=Acetobacter pomorum TaxID=65959 RepID=UPI0012702015|nr:Hint domain-containing protein [Acetobacter pomorum]KAA8429886.1 hypothetical protein FKW54_00510 [Acetobacter pomorum]KAA8431827.1 hypothetical protein FKW50_11855 [Acetobacter pomorum]KAA8450321.1 hypothetical protein FKW52_10315 [Acetobacter pomorum]